MLKAPALLSNLLHSGKEHDLAFWDGKRIIIINFIILVAIPVFLLFTYMNFIHQQILFVFSNIASLILLLLTFFYFRFNTNIRHASSGLLLALLISHITALFQGGIANTGFFWFFYFPLFAVMLQGRSGSYWVLALLLSILGMYLYQANYPIDLPYEPVLLIILMISLSIETLVVIYVECVRMKYDQKLLEFQADLQSKVDREVNKNVQKDELLHQQSKMAAMGEMTNYIAHQWKQPLAVISTIVQRLSVQESLGTITNEALQTSLAQIDNQTTHMSQTMIDFNNFTKPDQPKEEFNVSRAIEEAIRIVLPLLESKEIILETSLANQDATFFAQKNLLIHVILNLINNAKDALVSQHIKEPRIMITLDEEGKQINIADNGNGVDPSIASSIFEAYFSTKGKESGGIGLHMCRRIIEDGFNGSLQLQESDQGADFMICLKTSSSEQ